MTRNNGKTEKGKTKKGKTKKALFAQGAEKTFACCSTGAGGEPF